jgi:hypothetical protein
LLGEFGVRSANDSPPNSPNSPAQPRFAERAAAVREGASKIWAQDVPVNLAMQTGKRSRFMPEGCCGPLETTLVQFNAWRCGPISGHCRPAEAGLREGCRRPAWIW